jgi:hypothetical protein
MGPPAPPRSDANAPWKSVEQERRTCDGDRDGNRHRPRDHRRSDSHEFKWEFRGVVGHSTYYANPGRDGSPGADGRDGATGPAGPVRLVIGSSIPTEAVSYQSPIGASIGQPITLLKNNWLPQTGLSALLAPGSNVPDSYQQLQTVRDQFQIDWQTPKSVALLGDPSISAVIDAAGQVAFQFPGHLEYRRTRQDGRIRIAIVNGINPDRLRQIKFRGFNQFQDARNFSLIDEGKLLPEIASLTVTVRVSDGSQTIEDTYTVSSKATESANLTVLGDIYKIQLGEKFTPLLRPAQALIYDLQIEQVARSGARYPSRIQVKQVVNQVTFPQVEYPPVPALKPLPHPGQTEGQSGHLPQVEYPPVPALK